MPEPIVANFTWTADELLQANRYHFRHTCRPIFRYGIYLIACLAILPGLASLVSSEELKLNRSEFLVALAGLYLFLVRPIEKRLWTRWKFRNRPDRDVDFTWNASDTQLTQQSSLGSSETTWDMFSKFVYAPPGVLLYQNDEVFHWVPREGFTSEEQFKRFIELAKSKIDRSYEVK